MTLKIKIVTPPVASTKIELDLCELTKEILDRELSDYEPGYGLGGHYGYGTDYENDTFMIHHFCWCEKDDCPWCGGCECPDEAFHYYVDGKEVSCKEWIDFYRRLTDGLEYGTPEYEKASVEANKRRKSKHISVCDFCLGKGVFATNGAEPGQGAPNFWYKPTNFKIWWYKWIGRDMEYNRRVSAEEWKKIFKDCLISLERENAILESEGLGNRG